MWTQMTIWHIFSLRAKQAACVRINAGWNKRLDFHNAIFYLSSWESNGFKYFRVNYFILELVFLQDWRVNLEPNKGLKIHKQPSERERAALNKDKPEPEHESCRPFILFLFIQTMSYLNACKYCYNNSFM